MLKILTICFIFFISLNFVSADYEEELARLIPNSPELIEHNKTIELNESQILDQQIKAEERRIKDNQGFLFWAVLFLMMFLSIVFLIFISVKDKGGSRL